MASFAIILFFALSGLLLNHPNWFAAQPQTSVRSGAIDASTLRATVDVDALLRQLREREHLRGEARRSRVDEDQISLALRAPGYAADVFIDRATGAYQLTEERRGWAATLGDLHKGEGVSSAWKRVIDACAIMLALVSITGFVLIVFLYKRRLGGMLLAAAGAMIVLGVWRIFVA